MPYKTQHAFLPVIAIHPLKTIGTEIFLIQRRLVAVKMIEILDPALQSGMRRILQNRPFQAFLMLPFTFLAEFAAHEQ